MFSVLESVDRSTPLSLSWRARLAWLGGLLLGAVLLVAAWGKALDPVAFAEQVEFEGMDILLPAGLVAWIVIVAEVAFGVALVLGLRTRSVLIGTGFLVAVFVFLTSRTYWRYLAGIEVESGCGCFGNLFVRSPSEAFWQDLLLLVPPFFLACLARRKKARWPWWMLVSLAGIAAGLFALLAPDLPLDDLATRLEPGTRVEELCAGSRSRESERVCLDLLVPELSSGRHLVVIDRLESEQLHNAVELLNGWSAAGSEVTLWLLADASDEERRAFFWEWGPLFEIREAPELLLRPLYRTLPRSFLVEDSRVVRTWSGLPAIDLESFLQL
jgi:uncharacterized membrane protein YphA (DoxX/SURF4 family)